MKERVMVGMSGGIDSSVSVILLQREGYEVSGGTMKLYEGGEEGWGGKRCCGLGDIFDARNVAAKLGIKHYIFNFKEAFAEGVIDRFRESYEEGLTPNPCLECNREIKFKKFLERAELMGNRSIATGHYARIGYEGGRYILKRGADEKKDQTYFLYTMTQEELSKTKFPLGELRKVEVREIGERAGLINAKKRESQDICFVKGKSYAEFLRERYGIESKEGNFIDRNGKVLGRHKGIINYTIGQRKGLGIGFGKHMYVIEKNAKENTVMLGEEKELYKDRLIARKINLISVEELEGEKEVTAKIRYSQRESKAVIKKIGEDEIEVKFEEPQRAVSPGQAVVFYDGEKVLGGGTIIR